MLVELLPFHGVDVAFAIPFSIILTVVFGVLIGIAIIKHRFLDITVFVRRGILYSIFAVLIVFALEISEDLIAMFLEGMIGGHSTYVHFVSVFVVIAALMPLKPRLERFISGKIAKGRIEF